jgi:hypothetical protein
MNGTTDPVKPAKKGNSIGIEEAEPRLNSNYITDIEDFPAPNTAKAVSDVEDLEEPVNRQGFKPNFNQMHL